MKSPGEGFAILLDREGRLQYVVRDEAEVLSQFPTGTLFPAIVARPCMDKALDFLVEIRERGAAFDREFAMPSTRGSYHFVGSKADERILVAASATREGTAILLDELLLMNSEQVTLIRSLRKEGSSQPPPPPADSRFDEISRLNNELVNAQRELVRKNSELARLDELKNRFLGMAAHDLRSPLAVSLGYADLLLEEPEPEQANRKAWLGRMRGSLQFMLALVNDLLDTAAIESGFLRLAPEPTDLALLLGRVIDASRFAGARRGVRVERVGGPEACGTVVDPVRIEQALMNLASNAVKFSPAGGRVELSLVREGGELVLRVVDQGPGMDPALLGRLFTPFSSPTMRTASGEKNTGLGLLIARRIAEAHGGSLRVLSEPGAGTRAEIRLPAPETAAGGPEAGTAAPEAGTVSRA